MSPVSCVVDICLSKFGTEAALHKFPRDAAQKQAWIDFVRVAGRHYWTPSKYTVLYAPYTLTTAATSATRHTALASAFEQNVSSALAPCQRCTTSQQRSVFSLRRADRADEQCQSVSFAQCVVDGVSGLPDSCEYAGIEETPEFSSSSTGWHLSIIWFTWVFSWC
ncbi:hypothetical protein V5799_021933 [Amblyomma americanum]|uniref:THAP-type domain-containing protein n=1 Tax=Amblyomma americanum TaxID=6943 RepID=A0AAQ4FPB8_AMBAM